MSDLFSAISCSICGKPVTELGCSAPGDVGAYCRAPIRRKVTFDVPANARRSKCASCDATIAFVIQRSGRAMPINVDGERRLESHFATCPGAATHRRTR